MSDLTDDEFSLLEIASHGESMIPIGRWERPLKSLADKGMMFAADTANYVITESGRAALTGHKDDVDTAWAKAAIAARNGAAEQRAVAQTEMVEYQIGGDTFLVTKSDAKALNDDKFFVGSVYLRIDPDTGAAPRTASRIDPATVTPNDRNTQKTRPGRSVVRQQR